jgi:hypothetical protein
VPAVLGDPPLQPLTLFDMEDMETALGHIDYALPDLLAQKIGGPYRRREFVLFQHDVLATSNTTRPALLQERWAELGPLLAETLRLDDHRCWPTQVIDATGFA